MKEINLHSGNYLFVKSKYSSPFIGIVLEEYVISTSYPKKYKGIGYKVLVVKDKSGNIPRKRIIHERNKEWFVKVKLFDISYINKDWL